MKLSRLLCFSFAAVGCSANTSMPNTSSTADADADGGTSAADVALPGPDTLAADGAPVEDSAPASEYFIRPFARAAHGAPYADLRVLTARDSGFLVYGNHQSAESASTGTAFVAKYDELGNKVWEADLGSGHVSRVRATSDGYLATGQRTVDWEKGAGAAFVASLDDSGKIRFETDAPGALARGMGVGTDAAGQIIVYGMLASTTAWTFASFRFKPTGEYVDRGGLSYSGRALHLYDAAVDAQGFGYVSTDYNGLRRVDSAFKEIWAYKPDGPLALDADDSLWVAAKSTLEHFAADGTRIGTAIVWNSGGGTGDSYPSELVVDGDQILVAASSVGRDLGRNIISALPIVKVFKAGTLLGGAKLVREKFAYADSAALLRSGALIVVGHYQGTLKIGDGRSVSSPGADANYIARVPVEPLD